MGPLFTQISEDAILEALKGRYKRNEIYTYIGPVVLSVNPFKRMPVRLVTVIAHPFHV
jgi:myosin I